MERRDEIENRSETETHPPYAYWPIVERPPCPWPDGRSLACFIGFNLEHFWFGRPSTSRTSVTANLAVDPLNHAWRDYGPRVGFWRITELLDELDIRASAIVNADVFARHPQIVEAALDRGWAWVAHGRTNSRLWTGLEPDEERDLLQGIVADFRSALGRPPRGWLGPALTETANTLRLLAELGFDYSLDWVADEQPFPLDVPGSRFVSIPYSIELNDIPVFIDQGLGGAEFGQMIIDQFDVLYAEAPRRPGTALCIAIHPFLVGHPFRFRHFARALRHIRSHRDVWFATSDDLAAWYLDHHYTAAVAALEQARPRRSSRP